MQKALVKKIIFRTIVLAILVGGGWYGYKSFSQGQAKGTAIATAKVQRGDVVIRAFTRGELKAVRVYPVYAPNLNGTVQVTALAPVGALAREKDLLVEYDDSELLGTIDADKLSLDNTDWTIKANQLSMQITKSQDTVKLLSAQYGVTRAALNVKFEARSRCDRWQEVRSEPGGGEAHPGPAEDRHRDARGAAGFATPGSATEPPALPSSSSIWTRAACETPRRCRR